MELALYHDCVADQEFDLSYVETPAADEAKKLKPSVVMLKPEKVVGNWDIADYNSATPQAPHILVQTFLSPLQQQSCSST
uniref:Uncharacterized protein n=1 Tax=Ditylenchus dipsaci TaxID=166011 RepID=A0A915EG72_9BILA